MNTLTRQICKYCVNLGKLLLHGVRGLLRWLRYPKSPPSRPLNWEEAGWDDPKNEAYGKWFLSGPRFLGHFLLQYSFLLLLVLVVLALVCGWGSRGLGIPLLFLDGRSNAFWSGLAVGAVLVDICYVGLLISSAEWITWWTKDCPETDRRLGCKTIDHYLGATLWFFAPALLLSMFLTYFVTPLGVRLQNYVNFGLGFLVGGVVLYIVIKLALTSNAPRTFWNQYVERKLRDSRWIHQRPVRQDVLNLHLLATDAIALILPIQVLAYFYPDLFSWAPPSTMLCLLLASIANLIGFVKIHGILSKPVLATGLLVLGGGLVSLITSPHFHHRFMDKLWVDVYKSPVKIKAEWKVGACPDSISSEQAVEQWRANLFPNSATKPKMVIFCVSGGGIKAQAWATRVLTGLEGSIPGFTNHVRLITGASGGMVGTAFCVAHLADIGGLKEKNNSANLWRLRKSIGDSKQLYDCATQDSLTPTVRWMVLRDFPQALMRPILTNFNLTMNDRGTATQRAWVENYGLNKSFGDIKSLEAQGRIPSLIFSPLIFEDGRQLLISNLDTSTLEGVDTNGDGKLDSLSAVSLCKLLGQSVADLSLATAARMNASFPYVGPAAELPTDPPMRLGDAGYFDNYGIKLACSWAFQHANLLIEQTSGIIFVQVRAGVESVSISGLQDDTTEGISKISEGLMSPIEGVMQAPFRIRLFTNDTFLYELRHNLQAKGLPVNVVTFEYGGGASLSWRLSEGEREDVYGFYPEINQADQLAFDADLARLNLPMDASITISPTLPETTEAKSDAELKLEQEANVRARNSYAVLNLARLLALKPVTEDKGKKSHSQRVRDKDYLKR
jgi:hypothetical protein